MHWFQGQCNQNRVQSGESGDRTEAAWCWGGHQASPGSNSLELIMFLRSWAYFILEAKGITFTAVSDLSVWWAKAAKASLCVVSKKMEAWPGSFATSSGSWCCAMALRNRRKGHIFFVSKLIISTYINLWRSYEVRPSSAYIILH